jgi:hypothetical protein
MICLSFEGQSQSFVTATERQGRQFVLEVESTTRLSTAVFDGVWSRLIARFPWRTALPSRLGLIVDPDWEASAGFWRPSLRTANGLPAVKVSVDTASRPSSLLALLAHELTHVVHYAARPQDRGWLREGLALTIEQSVMGRDHPLMGGTQSGQPRSLVNGLVLSEDQLGGHRRAMTETGSIELYQQLLQFFHFVDRACFEGAMVEALDLALAEGQTDLEWFDQTLRRSSRPSDRTRETCTAGFDAVFIAFHWARFSRQFHHPLGYISSSVLLPPVLAEPLDDQPRYSGYAYDYPARTGCRRGDIEVGPSPRVCVSYSLDR